MAKRVLCGILLSCAVVAVLASVGWYFVTARRAQNLASPDRARQRGRPIPVRTAFTSQSQVDEVIGATAVTAPSELGVIRVGATRLSPSREFRPTAVLIKSVHVQEGALVHRGDLLFELDEVPIGYVVAQRDAEFAAANAELELTKQTTALNEKIRQLEQASAQANLSFRNEVMRSRTGLLEALRQLKGTSAATALQVMSAEADLSQATFDLTEAENRLQRANNSLAVGELQDKLAVELAEAKNETARVAVEMAKSDMTACTVTSPIDGFIGPLTVVPGEVVDTTMELTRVFKLDPVHVRMDYPQERLDELEVGQSAEVVLDSFPKETFTGKVVRVPSVLNTDLRVLPVVIELDNPTQRIKAGISGFVRLHVTKKATTVPGLAVVQRGNRAMVFCVQDGRARIREVRTGPLLESGIMRVFRGLAPGEEVVVYGNEYLDDDDPVDSDWRRWAKRD